MNQSLTTASAQQVNTSLAASPMATISAIDSIGTPLSNQVAGEVRGAGFTFDWSAWAIGHLADLAVGGAVLICGATGPCVVAAGFYAAYRVLQEPIYEAAYVRAYYGY